MTPTMLSALWVFLSISIALGQLLAAGQSDWLVHGSLSQGLYANCYLHECQLRTNWWPLILLSAYLFGISILFLSSLISVPFLIFSSTSKPLQIVSNCQFVAVLLTGLVVVSVPMDMEDIHCTTNQLIKSLYCRVGWAYAFACVLSLISMCCPIMGRLLADHRKSYRFITVPECLL
uniref:G_PROTEIN_RECEP_F1_2 domain-containing protein n=1 Tax=Rhabditophanes sp. KR3021 TaxID=114890 RepID=A0AC35UDQ3_9BILA